MQARASIPAEASDADKMTIHSPLKIVTGSS